MVQAIQPVGALGILSAFVAALAGRLQHAAAAYLWPNVLGAGLLAVSAVLEQQWGFVLLEAVWTVAAAWGLRRLARPARPGR